MESKVIVQMDGKKTRLLKPNKLVSMREMSGRDAQYNDFTFDYSYWSFDDTDPNYTPQDQVFEDLGTDVVNSAFQGTNNLPREFAQTSNRQEKNRNFPLSLDLFQICVCTGFLIFCKSFIFLLLCELKLIRLSRFQGVSISFSLCTCRLAKQKQRNRIFTRHAQIAPSLRVLKRN
jgi:hypothetical protein